MLQANHSAEGTDVEVAVVLRLGERKQEVRSLDLGCVVT